MHFSTSVDDKPDACMHFDIMCTSIPLRSTLYGWHLSDTIRSSDRRCIRCPDHVAVHSSASAFWIPFHSKLRNFKFSNLMYDTLTSGCTFDDDITCFGMRHCDVIRQLHRAVSSGNANLMFHTATPFLRASYGNVMSVECLTSLLSSSCSHALQSWHHTTFAVHIQP